MARPLMFFISASENRVSDVDESISAICAVAKGFSTEPGRDANLVGKRTFAVETVAKRRFRTDTWRHNDSTRRKVGDFESVGGSMSDYCKYHQQGSFGWPSGGTETSTYSICRPYKEEALPS